MRTDGMRKIVLTVAVWALAGCMTMGSLDADNDSRISREEAAKSSEIAAAFGVGDSNDDGYLDPAEFEMTKEWLREASRGEGRQHDDGRGSHGH